MHVLFASSNPHKVQEVRFILQSVGIDVQGLEDLAAVPDEPEENGATFADNARIKAVAYARATGRMCLADDSGLHVDALGGAPGVHSARYAQISGEPVPADADRAQRDQANNALLLRKLEHVPPEKRSARFICAMCLADADGSVLAETNGTFEGIITDQPRGESGFGYDPLLYLPDARCTSAELSPEQKNARSHRSAAARAMAASLREHMARS